MGIVETARNELKNSAFFDETWPKEKFRQKLSQHTAQLVFRRIEQNNSISKPTLITGQKKYSFCSKISPKIDFFPLINHWKNFGRPKFEIIKVVNPPL